MILNDRRARPEPYRQAAQALGLEPGASEAEVKKAYRRTAQKFHPDQHASEGRDSVYAARFHLATTAKTLLLARGGTDEAKALQDFIKARSDYDKALKDAGITPRPSPGSAGPAAGARASGPSTGTSSAGTRTNGPNARTSSAGARSSGPNAGTSSAGTRSSGPSAGTSSAGTRSSGPSGQGRAWQAGSAEAGQFKPGFGGGPQSTSGTWRKWEPQEFKPDEKPKAEPPRSTWSRADFNAAGRRTTGAASQPPPRQTEAPRAETVQPPPSRTETVAASSRTASAVPSQPVRPDPRAQAAVAAYTENMAAPTGRRVDFYV